MRKKETCILTGPWNAGKNRTNKYELCHHSYSDEGE